MNRSDHHLYLAYGSNLLPDRLIERVGVVQTVSTVALPGWRLAFNKRGTDGSAKANLVPVPGSNEQAHGVVYRLARHQLPLLDGFEGCGDGYETLWLECEVEGRRHPVLTYLAPSHWQAGHLRPYDWYRDLVVAGACRHRFPAAYVRSLASVAVSKDPNSARAIRARCLLEALD